MSEIKAKIVGLPSKEMGKSNGGKYVLLNAEITEGPAKGLIVLATRTTRSVVADENGNAILKDGQREYKQKEVPAVDTDVVLNHSVVASTNPATVGQAVHFFEIGLSQATASNAEITAVLGGIPAPIVAEGQGV